MKKPMILLLCCSILTTPLLAQSAPTDGQTAAADGDSPEIVVEGERDPKDKKVCRVEVRIGSSLPKRVCRTVRESEELTKASTEALDRARDRESAAEFTRMQRRDGKP